MNYQQLWDQAVEAGMVAGNAAQPVPMTVRGSGILINGVPINNEVYHVAEGACGFAWVSFPGNDAFGRWAKQHAGASKHYPSGLCHWVSQFNQSVARKEAYARAFAQVLRDAGVKAYADSRLDWGGAMAEQWGLRYKQEGTWASKAFERATWSVTKTRFGHIGQGRAQALLCFDTHVVVNIGGAYGTPVVVNDSNYVSHRPRRMALHLDSRNG
jgi:hypothetical protein